MTSYRRWGLRAAHLVGRLLLGASAVSDLGDRLCHWVEAHEPGYRALEAALVQLRSDDEAAIHAGAEAVGLRWAKELQTAELRQPRRNGHFTKEGSTD